tara:strand:- start:26 stop:1093 length:1068 start_codon:yes stop_codon:yes gene_type:complete
MSGKGFVTELDASNTKTTYSIMIGDGTEIPELQEIKMKVDGNGWIEFHKGETQVNVAGKQMATYKQTYKFVEFGTDSDKYLLLARFDNVGDGQYLLYAPSAPLVDRWAFAADTAIAPGAPAATAADADDGLSNIMSKTAMYDRAFFKIIENSPNSSRVYPPKPYPSATWGTGSTVINDYSWTVDDAGYGNGVYMVKAVSSLIYTGNFNGSLDAEGIFNKGIQQAKELGTCVGAQQNCMNYSSPADGAASSFNFYLPVYIKLEKVNVFQRGNINHMRGAWAIHGVERSSGTAVETELYSNNDLTFETGVIKSLMANSSGGKFNEFKVSFDPVGGEFMEINEILFYGTDESLSAADV